MDEGAFGILCEQLKPYHIGPSDASRSQSTMEAISIKPPSKRRVEEILADRVTVVSKRTIKEYLVKWEGFSLKEISWERELDLQAFKQKIEEFLTTKSTRTSTDSVRKDVMSQPCIGP